MLFTPTAGVPDFSAMIRSCSSMTARAAASPSSPPRTSLGTLRLERSEPSSYTTSKSVNSARVAGFRAILVFPMMFEAATHRARRRNHRVKTNCPARSLDRQVEGQRRAKLECVHIYSRGTANQPAAQGGSQCHSSRITVETGPSDRGWRAHGPRKNKKRRRRRRRSAKPSARRPNPRRMKNHRPTSREGYCSAKHRL